VSSTQARRERRVHPIVSLDYRIRVVALVQGAADSAEESGFLKAAGSHRIDSTEMIHITGTGMRLLRVGTYPPLRGTTLSIDDSRHILYTRGSVQFFSTYPGMYIPRPLMLVFHRTEQTPRFLMNETLALTKMNWNNTQFDGADPITIQAAGQVGSILKYLGENDEVAARYSFYM
jgi:hypothetical protein